MLHHTRMHANTKCVISYVVLHPTLQFRLRVSPGNSEFNCFRFFFTDKKKGASNSSINGSSRNLWVSGLSTSTRATDLKHHFSKFGKVRD